MIGADGALARKSSDRMERPKFTFDGKVRGRLGAGGLCFWRHGGGWWARKWVSFVRSFLRLAIAHLRSGGVSGGVTMITDATGMMIAWWFGSRQIEKQTRARGNSTASASVK